jgi:predicted small secreted protein
MGKIMLKNLHYLLLLTTLIMFTGCETVHGMGQDIHNASNPDKNGWNELKKADAWMQEHMW